MRTLPLMILIASIALTAPAFAQSATPAKPGTPDVNTIVHEMKTALEPPRSSLRRIDLITHTPPAVIVPGAKAKEVVVRLKALQARKKLANANAILTVMVEPPGVRGAAYLVHEDKKGEHQWIYLPAIRRVRRIGGIDALQPFLGTDFTYADMGFINLHDRTFNLKGKETLDGKPVYRVEEVPSNQWYFSRIIDLVHTKTMLPLGRDFYDMASQLWKVEHVEKTEAIDGTPTITEVTMKDRPADTSTEMRVSEVRYDAKIPDQIFDPHRLPLVLKAAVWKKISMK